MLLLNLVCLQSASILLSFALHSLSTVRCSLCFLFLQFSQEEGQSLFRLVGNFILHKSCQKLKNLVV